MYGKVKERIARGAFDSVFERGDDVRSMFNHDPNFLLGRTPDTLEIGVDDRGLWFRTKAPSTSAGKDVSELVKRGDVDGASFWFGLEVDDYDRRTEGEHEIVEIRNISSLREVGPVVFPAYEATTANMRTADISREIAAEKPPEEKPDDKKQKEVDESAAYAATL